MAGGNGFVFFVWNVGAAWQTLAGAAWQTLCSTGGFPSGSMKLSATKLCLSRLVQDSLSVVSAKEGITAYRLPLHAQVVGYCQVSVCGVLDMNFDFKGGISLASSDSAKVWFYVASARLRMLACRPCALRDSVDPESWELLGCTAQRAYKIGWIGAI
jgi:hypothetical protein